MTTRVYINDPLKGYDYLCDHLGCDKVFGSKAEERDHLIHDHYPVVHGWSCPRCSDKK